jgi:hypothetical protein
VVAYDRLVRASGVELAPNLPGVTPEALAQQMAAPANAPMRKSTARYPGSEDLVMLAERFLSLG